MGIQESGKSIICYNLGQIKWSIWNTPHTPPYDFKDAKNGAFLLLRAFIIALGGRGLIVPIYSVQDCSLHVHRTVKLPL